MDMAAVNENLPQYSTFILNIPLQQYVKDIEVIRQSLRQPFLFMSDI
jgi:hypothetical protein